MRSRPTISLCAIVRNEAPVITGMLESVRGLVDEIVIVDTGSTDETPSLCAQHGARVVTIPWNDDFAAARNSSLQHARGDWILVLDADERAEPDQHELMRSLIGEQRKGLYVRRRHYTRDDKSSYLTRLAADNPYTKLGAIGFYLTNDLRFFRSDPRIQFSGVVHETAEVSMRACSDFVVEQSEIVLHHIGPLTPKGAYANKAAWYLTLAKKALAQTPRDWRAWYQVGAELQGNEKYAEAAECFAESLNIDSGVAQTWRQLGISLAALGKHMEALSALQKASHLDPSCPMTWNALGIALMECRFFDEAELCFNTTKTLDPASELPTYNLTVLAARRAS